MDKTVQVKLRETMADDGEQEGCAYCGRTLPAGLWFARIQRDGHTMEFCRPRCLESFLAAAGRDRSLVWFWPATGG